MRRLSFDPQHHVAIGSYPPSAMEDGFDPRAMKAWILLAHQFLKRIEQVSAQEKADNFVPLTRNFEDVKVLRAAVVREQLVAKCLKKFRKALLRAREALRKDFVRELDRALAEFGGVIKARDLVNPDQLPALRKADEGKWLTVTPIRGTQTHKVDVRDSKGQTVTHIVTFIPNRSLPLPTGSFQGRIADVSEEIGRRVVLSGANFPNPRSRASAFKPTDIGRAIVIRNDDVSIH